LERRVIWSEKIICSSKMKPRLRAEWKVFSEELCTLVNLIFEFDKQEFSHRGVKSSKICSHPGRDLFKSILKVSNA